MTTDPFITAARAEAEKRAHLTAACEEFEYLIVRDFMAAVVWARDYLAAQDPTDAEVEAAACALAAEREDIEDFDSLSYRAQEEFRADARLALNAAREVHP